MKKRMLVAMGWLLMALLLLPVGAMAQATQDVKIKVTNRVNRKATPVKDAKVTIVDANGEKHEGTTKDDGEAIVEGVPVPTAGTVTVESGATVVTAALTVDKSGKVRPKGIDLTKFKSVEVTVVDAVTGNGIPGATVTIGAQNAETKSQGKAMLNLMRGTFQVTVTANGYAESTVTRQIKRFNAPKPLLDAIELTPVKDVTIKVVNGSSPVSGATVKIVDAKGKEYKGTAGPTGEAVVKNVPVPIKENGTVTVEQSGQVVMTAPVKVNEAGTAESDNIDISQAKAVVVTVVDAKTKQGIEGATVAVGAQVVTTKGSAGKVTLNLLGGTTADPVQYRMVAKKEGYADSTVVRKVDHNGIANPNTIKLTPVRDVTITVTDNGAGVSGATVTIVDENGKEYKKTTGSDGNAVMPKVLAPTDGTLTVSAGGKEVSVPVTVDEDGNANLNTIDIQKIVPVIMTVVDEWAVPIPNGTVTVAAKKADIGSDGKVTLNLLGGMGIQYQMVAEGPDIYAVSTVVVSVDADGIADPNTIELKRKERVAITVMNNDQPEVGATVTIVDAEGNKCKVKTGSHGEADVPKMAGPTEWTVTVEKGGKVVTVPVKVDENGKVRPDTINIAKTWGVEVTVIDAVTGKGIGGASVTVGAQTVTADGDGKVVLNLQEGVRIQYQVETTADGYVKSAERRRVKVYNSSNPSSLGTIELIRLTGVTITVVNGNSPVEGATVTIVDGNEKLYPAVMTGNDGNVTVPNVPVLTDGTVTVKAMIDGAEKTVTAPVKIDGYGHPTPATIDFQNPKIVPVTMTVVDYYVLEEPIGSVTVAVGAQVADVENHKVTLYLLGGTGIPYQMKVEQKGLYGTHKVTVSVKDDGTANPDIIKLLRRYSATITVVKGNSPVEGATVTIVDENGNPHTAKTDTRGTALVPKVLEESVGTLTVRATIDDKDTVVTVPVKIGIWGRPTPNTIDIEKKKPGEVKVIEAKEVEVTVVNAVSNEVIPNATVTVGAQTVTTDQYGKVKLNLQIKKDGYPVVAKAEGHVANTVKVSVDEGGNADPKMIRLTVLREVEFDATEGRFADARRWRIASVAHGKSIQESKVEEKPTRVGYTFKWWSLHDGKEYKLNTPVKNDIKLTAVWKESEYTVRFDAAGGTPKLEVQTVKHGKTATPPTTNPTREGYSFVEWQLNGAKYRFSEPVYGSFTLKAEWEANGTAQWTVTFDYNDGVTAKKELKVDNGTTVTKPADPARTGFTFRGWNLLDGTGYDFTKPVNADITLKAEWEAKHTVTVKVELAGAAGTPVTPVAGATVRIGTQAPATTGPAGQVTAQLPNGAYPVAVQKAGYKETGRTPAGLTVNGADATLTVTLEPIVNKNPKDSTGTLELTVIGEDGQPLKETEVTIGGEKHTTDGEGKVTVQDVPVGTSTVPVAKEGYHPASVDVEIKGNKTTKATVKLVKVPAGTTPTTPTTPSLHTVTVKVELAGATGTPVTPVAGATVRIGTRAPEPTGPAGQVTAQLPNGAYPVAVQKAGYKEIGRTPDGLTVDGQDATLKVTLKPIETSNPKDSTGTLELTVIGEDGQPLTGTEVTIGGEKHTTDGEGKVTLQAVPVGTSTVPVAKEGYYPASVDVEIKENKTTKATVKLVKVPAGTTPTTPTTPTLHTVTVKVELAGAAGTPVTPVAGATVRIGTRAPEPTGPAGQVTAQLPNGAYPVAVQKAGYKETGRTPAGLTVNGADATLTVTLEPIVNPNPGAATGTLELTVTGEDGQPLKETEVTIGGKEYKTDGEGKVTLRSVPVGTSTVPVAKEGYEPASVDVTIDKDKTTEATVKLVKDTSGTTPKAKTYTVTVKTQLADGTAVSGATVRIGTQAPAATNDDGQVTIQLPDGAYPVAVQKAGYKETGRTPAGLNVDGQDVTLTVTLAPGTVVLTVTDEQGNKLPGATVTIGRNECTTDRDGKVTLVEPGGTETVKVSNDGHQTVDKKIDFTAGVSIDITITLVPSVLDIGLDALYIFEKDTYTFKAYEDERLLIQNVEWSVKDESVAKIDPPAEGEAVLTALKVGATTLTASYGGRQVVCAVYVLSYNRVSPVESAQLAEASCYPNPFSTVLYLKGVAQVARYEIYSPLGQLVYGSKGDGMPEYQIQCQGWADGFYLIVLTDHEGHTKVLKAVKR